MGRVGRQARDGPDEVFAEIEQVRDGVLDGAAALCAVGEIDLAVGRAVEGEMLCDRTVDLERTAEASGIQGGLHGAHPRMRAVVVAHTCNKSLVLDHVLQGLHAFERSGQRFLDEEVESVPGHLQRNGDVRVRRRRDEHRVPGSVQGLTEFTVGGRHGIPLRDRVAPFRRGLADAGDRAARGVEAPDVTLANGAHAHHQNAMFFSAQLNLLPRNGRVGRRVQSSMYPCAKPM